MEKAKRKRRTKLEMQEARLKEAVNKKAGIKKEKIIKPVFECCREIHPSIDHTHDLQNKNRAVMTKEGLMCGNCLEIFKRTKRGVEHYNQRYAIEPIELDKKLAAAFELSKNNRKEEIGSILETKEAKRK